MKGKEYFLETIWFNLLILQMWELGKEVKGMKSFMATAYETTLSKCLHPHTVVSETVVQCSPRQKSF